MKTYIVYDTNGVECGYIKAGSHNSAEQKARKRLISKQRVDDYVRVNPWMTWDEAFKRLSVNISVAYTEL